MGVFTEAGDLCSNERSEVADLSYGIQKIGEERETQGPKANFTSLNILKSVVV